MKLFTLARTCSAACIMLGIALMIPAKSSADNLPPDIVISFGARTVNEDTPLVLPPITVTDSDAGANSILMRLSCTWGWLTLASTTGLTFTQGGGGGGAIVEATGTLVDWNSALVAFVYTPSENYNGPDAILLHADDLGWSGPGGPMKDDAQVAITVVAVNDGPELTNVPTSATAISEVPLLFSPLAAASDPDIAGNMAKCRLTALHGVLTVANRSALMFTMGDGLNDATMEFYAALSASNLALAQVTYTSAIGYLGSETISITLNDRGYSGSGGERSATVSIPVTVTSPTAVSQTTWGAIKSIFFTRQ